MPSPDVRPSQGHPEKYSRSPMKNRCWAERSQPGYLCPKKGARHGQHAEFYMIPHSQTYGKWGASALQATISMGRGRYCACQLTALVQQFLNDRAFLPVNPYGDWNQTMLIDEDLSNDINLYLHEIGKDVSAKKVVQSLTREEVKQKHSITKAISEWTAHRYSVGCDHACHVSHTHIFVVIHWFCHIP